VHLQQYTLFNVGLCIQKTTQAHKAFVRQ